MFLKFGNYTHPINNAGVSIDSTPLMDASGEIYAHDEKWTVDFRLPNTTTDPKNLDTAVNSLIAAYAQDQASAYILHPDGTNTVHKLDSSNIRGGVRVIKPPSFLKYQNGEMVTYRTGRLQIAGTKFRAQDALTVVDFKETIDITQPGSKYEALTPNTGPSIIQRTATGVPATCTQSGTITYFGTYGNPPAPVFSIPMAEPPRIQYSSPTKVGSGATAGFHGFPVSYTYRWVWPQALNALPTRWNG